MVNNHDIIICKPVKCAGIFYLEGFMATPRTNWVARRKQLRREAGINNNWAPDPPSVTRQLQEERATEAARHAQIPQKTARPTSARQRKLQRAVAKSAQKKNGRKRSNSGR
jgi:hypothetical protein